MNCFHHPNQVASAKCSRCGQPLCTHCANLFEPPVCLNCAGDYADEVKTKMLRNIGLSIVLGIAGLVFFGDFLAGIVLLGFPYGWSLLSRNRPRASRSPMAVAMILPFRLMLALCIGIIVAPIQIIRWVKEMKRANALQKSVSQHRGG